MSESVLENVEIVGQGDKATLVGQQYVPPVDGEADQFHRADMSIARGVAETLVKNYPAYKWHVMADSKQGIVAFSIPELMGPTLKYVIKLGVFQDLTPHFVMLCGGELLERMHLPRGAMNIAAYAAAKAAKYKFDFADVRSN